MKKLRQDGGYGVNTKAKLYTSTTETENKRFLNNGSMIFDNRTPLTTTETVDLLNELNDENKLFKAEIEQLKKCYNNALDEMDTLAEVNDKIYKENKELKKLNSNIQKSIDYQDETIKEQCNKLDWASECGVRWEDEYNKWIGNLRTEK